MIRYWFILEGCLLLSIFTKAVEEHDSRAIENVNCTQYLIDHNVSHQLGRYDSESDRMDEAGLGSLCPPWYSKNMTDGKCYKGDALRGIVDIEKTTGQTWLQKFYCMTTTFNNDTHRIDVVGRCLTSIAGQALVRYAFPLPCNISELNDYMCSDLNREGQLCGRCMKDFAPPVYSYSLGCVKCTDYHSNWLKYIQVAFGPLTLFCLLICLFHISATSPYLHGFVFFSQIVTTPIILRMIINGSGRSVNNKSTIIASEVYISLMSIWNLDFFHSNQFCLHRNMTIVQALALNYLVALYPILLLLIAFTLVKMYSRNVRLIVIIWKPFRAFLGPCLRNFNIQTSLIESFATLFFLSAMKVQSVSVDLLAPTALHFRNGKKSRHFFLYYAAEIEYFGSHHLPYGVLALILLVLFLVLPALLLSLYPCHFFQRFLNRINCNSLSLKIFMDVFQGNYKDGTNNTRDYRYFSAIFFCARFVNTAIFLTLNSPLFFMFSGAIFTMLGFSIAIIHPQKGYVHYLLDCLILMILSLILFSEIGSSLTHTAYLPREVGQMFQNLALCLPLIYVVGLMCYWVVLKKKVPQNCGNFLWRAVKNLIHRSKSYKLLGLI